MSAVMRDPGSAEGHQALCSAFRQAGRIDDAIAFYTGAVSSNPDSGELSFQLANLLKDSGRTGEALTWYGRALQRMPDDVRVLNNAGNLLNASGRLQEAVENYSRAASLAPGNALIRSNLGAALKNQGLVAEAIACQEEALRLNPGLASALSNLAACLNCVDHRDRERVLEVHTRCVLQALPRRAAEGPTPTTLTWEKAEDRVRVPGFPEHIPWRVLHRASLEASAAESSRVSATRTGRPEPNGGKGIRALFNTGADLRHGHMQPGRADPRRRMSRHTLVRLAATTGEGSLKVSL
jgi:tetratricopeptide (TPR) repeat protein